MTVEHGMIPGTVLETGSIVSVILGDMTHDDHPPSAIQSGTVDTVRGTRGGAGTDHRLGTGIEMVETVQSVSTAAIVIGMPVVSQILGEGTNPPLIVSVARTGLINQW